MSETIKHIPERSLDEREIDPDPIRQFQTWFQEAVEAKLLLPEAMVLATATADGNPSARLMLMKGVNQEGFTFFTNYRSRKARELDRNTHASLLFYWGELARQVRIEGTVELLSEAESEEYFHTRPRESQISGVISPQSEVIASRAELERLAAELTERYKNQPIPRPPTWGGYRLMPTAIEFWQGREARLHDRILYERQADGRWKISRLAP